MRPIAKTQPGAYLIISTLSRTEKSTLPDTPMAVIYHNPTEIYHSQPQARVS